MKKIKNIFLSLIKKTHHISSYVWDKIKIFCEKVLFFIVATAI